MMLEEGSFRGRRADFVYMFLLGGALMVSPCSHKLWFGRIKISFSLLSICALLDDLSSS